MADVIIYGPSASTYVRTVRLACAEKGITHTLAQLAPGALQAAPPQLDLRLALSPGGATYLAHQRGRVVSQMEITEHLYAQDFERESNSIEVLVGRVRRRLGTDVIKTRRGFGYYMGTLEE